MELVRLFVVENKEIKSRESTIQGSPTAMGAYALVVIRLPHFLNEFILINEGRSKDVALTDKFAVARTASEQQNILHYTSLNLSSIWLFPKTI